MRGERARVPGREAGSRIAIGGTGTLTADQPERRGVRVSHLRPRSQSHVEDLRRENIQQRTEGTLVLRRARARFSARGDRRRLWQQSFAWLPCAQPERIGADDRRRRLRSLGVQRDRALSFGEVWNGNAVSRRSPATSRYGALDGL